MSGSPTILLAVHVAAAALLLGCGGAGDSPDDGEHTESVGGSTAGEGGGDGGALATGGSDSPNDGGFAGTAGAGEGGSDPVSGVKHNPGHYISMRPTDGDAEILDSLRPGVRGVQIRYTWRSLEPTQGVYDLGELQSDLDLLAGEGKHLIALVEDKSFDGSMPTPDYLSAYTLPNTPGGYTVARWDPFVVDRLEALMQALGARFDAHPGLEAVGIQETALGVSPQQRADHGYTPEAYRDGQIQLLTTMKVALPSSQVFWYMNFFAEHQSYIGDIAAAVAPLGVSMGGPDILPESPSLLTHVYPLYEQFAGSMQLFCSAQYDSYEHVKSSTGDFYTPAEIFEYGRDTLQVSYVLWNHKTWSTPAGSYNWLDALPVIDQNRTFN